MEKQIKPWLRIRRASVKKGTNIKSSRMAARARSPFKSNGEGEKPGRTEGLGGGGKITQLNGGGV